MCCKDGPERRKSVVPIGAATGDERADGEERRRSPAAGLKVTSLFVKMGLCRVVPFGAGRGDTINPWGEDGGVKMAKILDGDDM